MLNLKPLKLKKIVLIGASTGGPGQIKKIISALPMLKDTSIIIAQHMADGFLQSFVTTLNDDKKNTIEITKDKKQFSNNTIYVCEKSISVRKVKDSLIFIENEYNKSSFNPDINLVFSSFVPLVQDLEILCVILTGIGDDGVDACRDLSNEGVRCLTETNNSAIIDGMPSRAREFVPSITELDIDDIVKSICEFCK